MRHSTKNEVMACQRALPAGKAIFLRHFTALVVSLLFLGSAHAVLDVDPRAQARTSQLANESLYGTPSASVPGREAFALYRQRIEGDSNLSLERIHALLAQAVEENDGEAKSLLGQLIQEGQGVEPNPAYALDLFRQATAQGSASGAYHLGLHYLYAQGAERDRVRARQHLDNAHRQGYGLASVALAELALREGQHASAREHLQRYAAEGYPQAHMVLAEMYSEGLGVERQPSKTIEHLQQAWRMGWPEAAYQLYFHYKEGMGTARDIVQAVAYLNKAAEMGHADAKAELCLTTWYGNAVVRSDVRKAFSLCKASAEAGSALGAANLAGMYLEAEIPERSVEKRRHWIEVAAERGHARAMAIVSANYFRGEKGFPRDIQKGFDWMKRSAEAGWIGGMVMYAGFLVEVTGYDVPSLNWPDWEGCWYWLSIKQGLLFGTQSETVLRQCADKVAKPDREARRREIAQRIADYEESEWVIMYRRDVAAGKSPRF